MKVQSTGYRVRGNVILFTVFFLIMYAMGAAAQEGSLELVVGQQKVIDVDYPQRIAIGNGNIADVFLTSNKKQILVTGKSAGTTDLIIWDKGGSKGTRRITIWDKDPKIAAEEITKLLSEMDAVKVSIVGSNIVLDGELFKQEDLYRFNSIVKCYLIP